MPTASDSSLLLNTVSAILPLFLLMAAGVFIRRASVLQHADASTLSKFALDIALPAIILRTIVTQRFSAAYFLLPISLWVSQIVAIGAVILIGRLMKLTRHSTGAALFAIFGNTSFVGYPITTALFPTLLPASVILDQFGMWPVLYVATPIIASLYGERPKDEKTSVTSELLNAIKSPLLASLLIGLALRGVVTLAPAVLHNKPVEIAITTLNILGGAAIPVIMVALGMRLSGGAARKYIKPVSLIAATKLILMPLITFAVARYVLHVHGSLSSVSVLESAVPPAATSVVFAARYRMNSDFAVATFFVLTVASAFTIPLMVLLLR